MKHIRRFKDIIHANVNSALDRAENPEKMIRFMLQEMEESLTELKSSCTSKIADRARTEQELAQLQEAVARWNNRAELAVEKGKDSLAREALTEKRRAQQAAQAVKDNLVKLDSIISECRISTQELEQKLQAVKEKQRILIQRGIHAQETILTREQIKGAEGEDAYRRFSEFEQRIERMEAEAEMSGFGRTGSPAENQFFEMEYEEEVEAELASMKKAAKPATSKTKV